MLNGLRADRRKAAENLQFEETATLRDKVKRPKLDGFAGFIDQWLQDDIGRPRKQRHTAKRIPDVDIRRDGIAGVIRQMVAPRNPEAAE